MNSPVLEVFKAPGAELFHWRLCAETGERFAVSTQGFKRKKDAVANAEDAQAIMAQATISVIA